MAGQYRWTLQGYGGRVLARDEADTLSEAKAAIAREWRYQRGEGTIAFIHRPKGAMVTVHAPKPKG